MVKRYVHIYVKGAGEPFEWPSVSAGGIGQNITSTCNTTGKPTDRQKVEVVCDNHLPSVLLSAGSLLGDNAD